MTFTTVSQASPRRISLLFTECVAHDRFLRTIHGRKNGGASGYNGACRTGSEDASLQRHVRGKVGSNGVPTISRGRGLRPR